MDPHRIGLARSLAYHEALASQLLPEHIATARARLERWLAEGRSTEYARRWLELLDGPRARLVDGMCDPREHARDLRSSTPFAGLLPPKARWALWREVRARLEQA